MFGRIANNNITALIGLTVNIKLLGGLMDKISYRSPFSLEDKDRNAIWNMIVKKDIQAFINQDWAMIAGDFLEDEFMGIDCNKSNCPDDWLLKYPQLSDYQKEWLHQAKTFSNRNWQGDVEQQLYNLVDLTEIDISKDRAVLHKKFSGTLVDQDSHKSPWEFQTIYRCRKVDNVWKIAGFVGYLPYDDKLHA